MRLPEALGLALVLLAAPLTDVRAESGYRAPAGGPRLSVPEPAPGPVAAPPPASAAPVAAVPWSQASHPRPRGEPAPPSQPASPSAAPQGARPPSGSPAAPKSPAQAPAAGSPSLYQGEDYAAPSPGEDDTFGTARLQSPQFDTKGRAFHWLDPRTGEHVTSVVPPPPPPSGQAYGPIIVAPQVFPGFWGGDGYLGPGPGWQGGPGHAPRRAHGRGHGHVHRQGHGHRHGHDPRHGGQW